MRDAFDTFDVAQAFEPAEGKNHDFCIVREDCIVVVDGATPLEPLGTADAASVRALSRSVATALATSTAANAVDRFLEVSDQVQTSDGSSAVAAAVWRDRDQLVGASVGDCVVAVETLEGKVTVVFDHTLTELDSKAVARMHQRDGRPHRQDALDLLVANRLLLNTSHGYGAFGPAGMRPGHVKHLTVPLADVARVLVCSDGFWRALDTYGIYASAHELLEHASASLQQVVKEIRQTEQSDRSGERFPRISGVDDVTAVLLTHR